MASLDFWNIKDHGSALASSEVFDLELWYKTVHGPLFSTKTPWVLA